MSSAIEQNQTQAFFKFDYRTIEHNQTRNGSIMFKKVRFSSILYDIVQLQTKYCKKIYTPAKAIKMFGNRTFDFVRFAILFCEFDFVRLRSTTEH